MGIAESIQLTVKFHHQDNRNDCVVVVEWRGCQICKNILLDRVLKWKLLVCKVKLVCSLGCCGQEKKRRKNRDKAEVHSDFFTQPKKEGYFMQK